MVDAREHVQPALFGDVLEPVHRVLGRVGALTGYQAVGSVSSRNKGQREGGHNSPQSLHSGQVGGTREAA